MAATLADPATDRIKNEIVALLKKASETCKPAEDEGRNLDPTEMAKVASLMGEVEEKKKLLKDAHDSADLKARIAAMGDEIGMNDGDPKDREKQRREDAARGGFKAVRANTRGQHFVQSAAYRDLLKQAGPAGFSEKQRVNSAPEGFETLLPASMGQKALVTGADEGSAGALVTPQSLGLLFGPEEVQRPLGMRDLVTSGSTDTDTIDYVKITGFSNNAAAVPEATATTGTTGIKPESGFSFGRDQTFVKTIAHWIPVTKRALSDAAQIRTLIDNFLLYGLEAAIEREMISGDGTGEHFTGLENVSGTQSQTAVTDPAGLAGYGNLLALRRAQTKVRLYGGGVGAGAAVANGYVMHPLDREMLDEIITPDGRFHFGGPSGSNSTNPLWGLPVIENENMERGTAWCADWRWAVLYDREQANIAVSDSHENFFVRNMVAILAELRAAFAVLKPAAFVKVTLNLPAAA